MTSVEKLLTRVIRSRRTTMTLLAFIIGINTLYMMESDSAYERTFMVVMITLAALAIIMRAWADSRGENELRIQQGYKLENIMLGMMLGMMLAAYLM